MAAAALAALALLAAPRGAAAALPDAAILRPGPSSLALGGTSGGSLLRGRQLRPGNRHWAFMPHIPARGTTFGIDEMQGFLDRLGERMAGCRRGSHLRVGNVSLAQGGPSPWHRSHQSGRDVDLAPMLLDRKGKASPLDDYVVLDRAGRASDGSGRRLDERCTLRLLVALAQERTSPVQRVFLSRGLKAALLREARRAGLDASLRERLDAMVSQPSDSAPHDDHLHVRLFCPADDRRHGCLDRGPERAWIDRDEAGFQRHRAEVEALAADGPVAVRREATRLLLALRRPESVPALAARLLDADLAVRQTAVAALVAIGDAEAAEAMVGAIGRVEDDELAGKLYDVAVRLRAASLHAAAVALVATPQRALQPAVLRRAGEAMMLRAIRTLREVGAADAPAPAAVQALVEATAHPSVAVRRAAHDGLRVLTTAAIDADPSDGAALAAKWRAFWDEAQRKHWTEWVIDGLRARKIAVTDAGAPKDRKVLLQALRHPDPAVVAAAHRLLGHAKGLRVPMRIGAALQAAWKQALRRRR